MVDLIRQVTDMNNISIQTHTRASSHLSSVTNSQQTHSHKRAMMALLPAEDMVLTEISQPTGYFCDAKGGMNVSQITR